MLPVLLVILGLGGVASCAGPGGEVREPDPGAAAAALHTTNRTIFVVATRQKARIIESLEAVGIKVSQDLAEAGFMLRVTVGTDQGWRDCGTRNNVKYSLRREGVAVVELAEKGWTGTCTPNVFDVLSRQLAEVLASDDDSQGAPAER